ncbi:hypothetical protein [Microvirga alba]|uniref:DUF1311 domain-containing protein n=1 Tax=Microvirga alba TaxID=2791025 RepID=A0A931BPB3_9HYPH|nr:hypothetical protein [Microvirga alba]MBF9234942.1 hypothetical protein [Microvirga alba]
MRTAVGVWTLALLALGAPSAFAAPPALPQYAIKEWCAFAATLNKQEAKAIHEGCLSQEQKSYSLVKARWDFLPDDIRRRCIPASRRGHYGSYFVLRMCIWGELPDERKHELVER